MHTQDRQRYKPLENPYDKARYSCYYQDINPEICDELDKITDISDGLCHEMMFCPTDTYGTSETKCYADTNKEIIRRFNDSVLSIVQELLPNGQEVLIATHNLLMQDQNITSKDYASSLLLTIIYTVGNNHYTIYDSQKRQINCTQKRSNQVMCIGGKYHWKRKNLSNISDPLHIVSIYTCHNNQMKNSLVIRDGCCG